MGGMPLFSAKLQKLWNALELRLLVLLSLFLQFILISIGSRRKYSNSKWIAAILWASYLSADSVANLALGVLSQAERWSKNVDDAKHTITVFWAPFLLLHLGGPDTITAYALADNELWSRHLLGLISQVSIALYVFIRSFTPVYLNFLWILIFLAGVVKYGERSWVLFSSSKKRYRDSVVSSERREYSFSFGPFVRMRAADVRKSDDCLVAKASVIFKTFKRLFTDLILNSKDREMSESYFSCLSRDRAFGIVEIELGFVYDLFYTKSSLVFSRTGIFLRLFSCSSTIAAFVAFAILEDGHYPETEVIVTYILLAGAVFLEIYAILILFLSERMMIYLGWDTSKWPISLLYRLRIVPAIKRWSNSMGQYNMLDRCLKYTTKPTKVHTDREKKDNSIINKVYSYPEKIDNFITKFRQDLDKDFFWKSVPVGIELKELIFHEMRKNRGGSESHWVDQILKTAGGFDVVEFDKSILIWHVATDICYYTTVDQNDMSTDNKSKWERCILLSNYMMHLMMTSPFMLPSGTGQICFEAIQDTFVEAAVQRGSTKEEVCKNISRTDTNEAPQLEVKGDTSKSLLFDARRLADYLKKPGDRQSLEKITQAWLDMLTFAAAQCSWINHAEKLSQGGELLTHVWLLMTHFGMTDRFQAV